MLGICKVAFAKANDMRKTTILKATFRQQFAFRIVIRCIAFHDVAVYIRLAKGILRHQGESFSGDKTDFLPSLLAFACRLSMFVRYMV